MINLQSLGLVPITDNSPVPVTPPPQRGGSRLAKFGLVPIEEPQPTPLADPFTGMPTSTAYGSLPPLPDMQFSVPGQGGPSTMDAASMDGAPAPTLPADDLLKSLRRKPEYNDQWSGLETARMLGGAHQWQNPQAEITESEIRALGRQDRYDRQASSAAADLVPDAHELTSDEKRALKKSQELAPDQPLGKPFTWDALANDPRKDLPLDDPRRDSYEQDLLKQRELMGTNEARRKAFLAKADRNEWKLDDWIQYGMSLPYQMDFTIMYDPALRERYRRLNAIATGQPVKDFGNYLKEQPLDKQKQKEDFAQLTRDRKDLADMESQNPMDVITREDVAAEAQKSLPGRFAESFGTGLAEGMRGVRDALSQDADSIEKRQYEGTYLAEVQGRADEQSSMPYVARIGRSAAESFGYMAPALAAGAATANPYVTFAVMGSQVGLNDYGAKKAEGWSDKEAILYGLGSAAAEIGSEILTGKLAGVMGLETGEMAVASLGRKGSKAVAVSPFAGVRRPVVRDMLERGAGSILDAGGEVATNFLGDARDGMAALMGRPVEQQDVSQMDTFVIGLISAGLMHAPSFAAFAMDPANRVKQAEAGIPEDAFKTPEDAKAAAYVAIDLAGAAIDPQAPDAAAKAEQLAAIPRPAIDSEAQAWAVAQRLGATREEFDALTSNFDPRTEDEWQQVLTPFRDQARKRMQLARQRRQAAPTDDVWKIVPANAEQIAELRKKGFRGKALAGLTQGEYSQIVNGNWTPAKLREYRRSQRATADSPSSAEQAAAPPAPEQLAPEVGVPPTDSMQAPGAEVAALPAEQTAAPEPVEQAAPVVEAAPPVAQEPVDPYPGRKRKLTDATPERGEAWLRNTLERSPSGLDAAGVSAWIRKGFGDDHYWAALQNRKQTLEQYVAEQMGQPVAEAPVAPVAEAPPAVAPPAPKPKNKLGAKKPTPIAVTPEDVGIGDRPPVNPDYGAAYPDGAKAMGQHADLDAVEFAIREQVGDAKITQEPGEDYVAFKVNGKPLYEALIQGNGEWLLLKKPETVEPAASTPPPLPSAPPPLPQQTANPANIPDGAAQRMQAIFNKALPESQATVERIGDRHYRVTFGNGNQVEVKEVDRVPITEKEYVKALADYGLEDTPANREKLNKARGAFKLRTGGKDYDAPHLIYLRTDLGERAPYTLRHETIHFAKKTGAIGPELWQSLAEQYAPNETDAGRVEELVARGLETDPDANKAAGGAIRKYLNGVLKAMGLKKATVDDLANEIRSGKLFAAPEAPKPKRAFRAKKAAATEPVQGEIGMKLAAGETAITSSGRQTTPFPKFNSSRGLKQVDRWLLENALAEAQSRGDEFNARQFEGDLQGKTIPQASKDAAEQYLFGEQPEVPKPLLKPLVTPPAKNSIGRKKAKQKPLEFDEASELKAPSGTASVRSQGAGDTPYTPKTAPNSLVGIPAPELFQLAKELLGGKIPVVRKMAKALGRFRYMEGVPSHSEILLNPSIAKTEQALTATLAHEIGHLIDYLPEGTLKRGNLLGRVATLRKYLKGYLDGVGSNKEIKAELIELTKWWSGDWEGAEPAYKKYRESSRELYAEALSVFLNSPGDLEQRAPTFWKGFTEHLNKKPQVLQAYLEAQQLMAGTPEALAEKRSQNIREMFERGDEAIRASTTALSVARRSSVESIKQTLEMAMLDKTSPIKRRVSDAKKRGYDPADRSNPYYLLDELGNVDSDNYVMLSQIERKVDKLLDANGLTRGDIGEYLFTRRIVNERNEILNSLLITPSAAKQLLSHMEQTLGPEKFRALEMAAETYHDIVYKQMLNAVDAGLYSQQKLEEKIEPNKYNYATFAVVHYLENSPHISASMREQVGTTSDTANGYDATIMKMMTVNRLAKLNRAKRSIRDFMQQWFPQEITQVDVPYNDNKPSMPAPHGMEYLLMLEDGKPQAWAVPKSIVDMFKSHDVGQLAALGAFVQTELYGTLHPLLVTFNPNFQVQNPGRDIRRTYANLGAIGDAMYADKVQELVASGLPEKTAEQIAKSKRITLGQVLKAYWKTKGIAWRRAAGLHDDYIEMMVKNGALDVPFVQVDPAIIGEKGAAKYLMAQYGMADAKEAEHPSRIRRKLGRVASKGAEASKYVLGPLGFQAGTESASPGLARKALQKLGDLTKFVGVMQETHAKVAGNLLLEERGVPVKQRSWMVRKYVGTPDTRQRGLYTAITNSFSLYHKVKLNGLQWDADLAFDSKTAAGWWARKVTTTVIPTILTKLASYGALGLGIKAVLDAIPNYYLDTYNILALPWMLLGGDDDDEKGKAIFITVAQDETSQIISRLTALAMDAGATVAGVETRRKSVGDSATEAVGVLADAVGMSPNPYISIAYRWGLFAMGINPVDPHYQAPIVPPTEFEAGDIWKGDFSAVRKMGAWTAGQFGVASTVGHAVTGGMLGETFESDKQESSLEYFLRSTPGLSRFVRISDRGYTEEHWAGVKAEEREHKRFLLGLPQHARAATKKLMYLRDRTAELTPKEWHDKNLLSNWYYKVYLPATRELPKANQERRQQLMANLDRSLDEIRKDREQPVALRYLEMALLSNDRPSKTDEESQEAYDARLSAWEASLELATGWLEANKGSKAVQAALGEVRRTKAFQRLRTGLPTTFGQRRKQQQANKALRMLAP